MNITTHQHRPRIGITMGDPAGIGPEIIVKAFSRPDLYQMCDPVIIGDRTILEKAAALLQVPLTFTAPPQSGDRRSLSVDLIQGPPLEEDAALLPFPSKKTFSI